ncbi:MAG: sulfatase-like hydrolase/transferase [Acidobacteria bacterium]|nr:sulfatase-like hydrolase/transferase [Acidobacteriota bacterium]
MTPVRSVLLLGLLLLLPTPAAAAKGPNILWVTVEDMSPRLASYGDHTVSTPRLDRLAREGVRHTRAFGVYGVCAPNRHALIMGMYPTSTGAMAMRTWKRTAALDQITDPELLAIPTYEATPPPEARCFPEYLRAAGYFCTNNAKTDYQFQDPMTAGDESGTEAHWRHRPRADVPFFSVFNFTVTHESGTFEPRSPAVTDPDLSRALALLPRHPHRAARP